MNGNATSALRRISEGFGAGVLFLVLFAAGVKAGWIRSLDVLLSPAYLSSWITGVWGGHGSEVYFLPVTALMSGILWVLLSGIRSIAFRVLVFGALFAVLAGLGSASFQAHQRKVRQSMQDEARKERDFLSSPHLDYSKHLHQVGGSFGRLDLLHALIKNPDLAGPAVPFLRTFVTEDDSPWTDQRRLAAQIIFKATGERIPYDGLKKDADIYKDPYDPSNTRK